VHQLKRDFPQLTIVLNGGVTTDEQIAEQLTHVDGVMLGRHAYHHPWAMVAWDAQFWHVKTRVLSCDEVEERFVGYMTTLTAQGLPWGHASRHMMGLRNGQPGARRWRQVWSDAALKSKPPQEVMRLARLAQKEAFVATDNAAVST
jgi:tRNA-dihydrouridine synthase A